MIHTYSQSTVKWNHYVSFYCTPRNELRRVYVRQSVSLSVSQSVRQSYFSCQRNSSETAQQNFVKLCSYEGHNV